MPLAAIEDAGRPPWMSRPVAISRHSQPPLAGRTRSSPPTSPSGMADWGCSQAGAPVARSSATRESLWTTTRSPTTTGGLRTGAPVKCFHFTTPDAASSAMTARSLLPSTMRWPTMSGAPWIEPTRCSQRSCAGTPSCAGMARSMPSAVDTSTLPVPSRPDMMVGPAKCAGMWNDQARVPVCMSQATSMSSSRAGT
jgi:hypothetical protein